VVQACLRRIEEVNPQLNAVVQLAAHTAQEQARKADAALARGEIGGRCHGVPSQSGLLRHGRIVSTWGTPGRAGYVPAQDATAVARLKAAGAIVLGKTNTPSSRIPTRRTTRSMD